MSNQPVTPATPVTATKSKAGPSNIRFLITLVVAVLADTVGAPFGEFGVVVFDILVAVILSLCLGGLRPEIVIACVLEAVPGFGLFPSWSLAVPALWARTRMTKSDAAAK